MVSTYIWVDTIASSDGVRKVCCPDGYSNHKNITVVREVQDEKPESVRQIVIEIAEENGEPAGALGPLRLESTWGRGVPEHDLAENVPSAFGNQCVISISSRRRFTRRRAGVISQSDAGEAAFYKPELLI